MLVGYEESTGWNAARPEVGMTGWVSVVTARLWCILAGEKKVSMLYFLIIEQRWTDIPMIPGIVSSSSTLKFTSKVLSLPETKELYF